MNRTILMLSCAIAALIFALFKPELTILFAAIPAFGFGDALLKKTKALPTGASAVTSDSIDLQHTGLGSNVADYEFLVEAPAVTTGMLGDAATIKYDLMTSDSSDMSSPTTAIKEVIVQTGAGGAGAAAATQRVRLPTDCKRYVAIKATKSATGDASSVSVTLSMKF